MSIVEIFALIFALAILTKLIIIFIDPTKWMKISDSLLKRTSLITASYLILAILTGFYVIQEVGLVNTAAVMLFTSMLIALTFIPYSEILLKSRNQLIKLSIDRSWLSIIIWIALALATLYALFM